MFVSGPPLKGGASETRSAAAALSAGAAFAVGVSCKVRSFENEKLQSNDEMFASKIGML